MPNRSSLLAEVDSILHKPTLTHEQGARAKMLLELADSITDKSELERGHDQRRRNRTAIREGRAPAIPMGADAEFMSYLRYGKDAVSENFRAAQGVATGGAGAYLVPQQFSEVYETELRQYDEIFDLAGTFPTDTGAPAQYPIMSDEQVAATQVNENTSAPGPDASDLVFDVLAFGSAPLYNSGMVTASVELVNDSHFPLLDVMAQAFAVRIARSAGSQFVTNLLAQSAAGITTASSSAILPDELFSMVDAVDPQYLNGASWLMNPSTFFTLLKLKATTNAYLFDIDVDERTLLGFRVGFCPSFPAIGAGNVVATFGRHDKFVRRVIGDGKPIVRAYHELYAIKGAVGFMCWQRHDAGLLASATQSPVKMLTMHS